MSLSPSPGKIICDAITILYDGLHIGANRIFPWIFNFVYYSVPIVDRELNNALDDDLKSVLLRLLYQLEGVERLLKFESMRN